jgi:arsenite oxidase small subunit
VVERLFNPRKVGDLKTKKEVENDRLGRLLKMTQVMVGFSFLISAASGVILLATDGSLWKLAASHAYGLIAICLVSMAMGVASLLGVRRMYSLVPVWAMGVIILQLGDLVTAPAYNMTIPYFASYLFSLPAFDLLLASQAIVVVLYFRGPRPRVQLRKGAYFEAKAKSDRRDFLRIMGSIGAFFVLTIVLAAIDLTSSQPSASAPGTTSAGSSTTQGSTTSGGGNPSGPIANVSDLQVGTPFIFDYPDSRHPSAVFKLADGSVQAFGLLCTHVCCTVQYDSGSKVFSCPCHASVFDASGKVIRGPAAYPLPKVTLQVDSSGEITPTGVSGASPCL